MNVVTEEDALSEAALFGGLPVADAQVQGVVYFLRPRSRPGGSAVNLPPYTGLKESGAPTARGRCGGKEVSDETQQAICF